MDHRSVPYQFLGLLWLGSSVQALLKATTGDRASTGKIKAQVCPKSPLMHKTCPKCLCLHATPTTPVWPLNAVTLSANLKTVVIIL